MVFPTEKFNLFDLAHVQNVVDSKPMQPSWYLNSKCLYPTNAMSKVDYFQGILMTVFSL